MQPPGFYRPDNLSLLVIFSLGKQNLLYAIKGLQYSLTILKGTNHKND